MEVVNSSGTFQEISCPRLLAHLHLSRFGGTLRISRGSVLKLLYFQAGEIAMASSNEPADHLAPILIREGKLKTEQLDLARKSAPAGTSLARVLVQMGFLTSGELFAGARLQLRQIVRSLLELKDGHYEIQSDYFPREITSLNVDTRDMLLDLIPGLPDRSFVLSEVGPPDSRYSPRPALRDEAGSRLPPAWRAHLGLFPAPRTIHEFGQAAGLDDFAASKAVYALSLLELLEPTRPESLAEEAPKTAPVRPAVGADRLVEGPEIDRPPAEPGEAPSGASREKERAAEPRTEFRTPHPVTLPGPVTKGSIEVEGARIPASVRPPPPIVPRPPRAGPVAADAPPLKNAGGGIRAQGAPIQLEFKGIARPRSGTRSRFASAGSLFSVSAGVVLLGTVFYWFIFLRQSPSGGGSESPPVAAEIQGSESPAAEVSPPVEPVGEPPVSVPSAEVTEPAAPVSTAPPPSEPEPRLTASEPEGEVSPPDGPGTTPPPAARATTPTPPGPISGLPPFQNAARFVEGRARLDRGDGKGAGAAWREMVRKETTKKYTLQIAIVCQDETLMKAAARTPRSSDFFVTPISLGDRSCFRLCWGAYSSQDEAQAAKAKVPEFFVQEGGHPLVVSLGKLTSEERR